MLLKSEKCYLCLSDKVVLSFALLVFCSHCFARKFDAYFCLPLNFAHTDAYTNQHHFHENLSFPTYLGMF